MLPENPINQVLLGRYRIDAFLSAGGMGAVYKVWDLQRNAYLAMKVLNPGSTDDPVAFRHFVREADDLKRLSHPNIVPFYGLFEENGLHFLLEAFINGPTLSHVLRQQGALPLPEAVEYLRALSAALGYAHMQGVVHADVKPGNVMRDPGGAVYLMDFGISRHMDTTTTTTLSSAGTPAYMAPEQVRGEKLTPAADIYSLGILFFEVITGRRPFLGNEPGLETYGETAGKRMMAAHLHLPPPDPRSFNPLLPPALTPVLLKALEKDPSGRYASTNAFYLAMKEAVENANLAKYETLASPPVRTEPVIDSSTTVNRSEILQQIPARWPERALPKRTLPRRALPKRALFAAAGLILSLAALFLLLGLGRIWNNRPWAQSAALEARTTTPSPAFTNAPFGAPSPGAPSPGAPPPAFTNTPVPVIAQVPTATERRATEAQLQPTATVRRPSPVITPTVPQSSGSSIPSTGESQWTAPIDGMVLVRIPAGPFRMGSNTSPWQFEGPEHTVELDEYWIDQIPVTNAMFAKFVEATNHITAAEKTGGGHVSPGVGEVMTQGANWRHPTGPQSDINGKDRYPVVQVSWNDAQAYCTWAGRRLLSEAEWEKAARGSDGRLYPWGKGINCSLANYSNSNNAFCTGAITPVDAYPSGASPYGVLDMTGNTWDWVADWYQADYYNRSPEKNPTGPTSGTRRVHRGGAWYNFDLQVQVTYRYSNPPDLTFGSVGFRCGVTRPR